MLRAQSGNVAAAFFPANAARILTRTGLKPSAILKKAGIKICSGGIIGMGETREDRCDLAFALKEVGANVVPINILNPIPGTPFEKMPPLPPMEILKTIACFRFILPKKEIMIAGGRTVNLRDMQSMVFTAGASALMVGNYLTTLNQPVEKDLQMLRRPRPGPELGQSRICRSITVQRSGKNIGGYFGETIDIRNCLEKIDARRRSQEIGIATPPFWLIFRTRIGPHPHLCFAPEFTGTNRPGRWRRCNCSRTMLARRCRPSGFAPA